MGLVDYLEPFIGVRLFLLAALELKLLLFLVVEADIIV